MAVGLSCEPMTPLRLLRIDASSRRAGSASRQLLDVFLAERAAQGFRTKMIRRDLLEHPPHAIDEAWIIANATAERERSPAQLEGLRPSDALVDELVASDLILVGLPIYNFQVPAAFKAWIDLVCRARKTFRYGDKGPEGLLSGKRAIVVIVSGGTKINGPADFVSGYIRHIFGFIGITDVTIVAADQLLSAGEKKRELAEAELRALAVSGSKVSISK
jgi:FMN-dependent NADH-azoreductase